MTLLRRLALGIVLLALLLSGAQTSRKSLEGIVTDLRGNTLPGAAVQLENTVSLNVQSYITQKDGRFYFNNLSDENDYTLKARYRNYWSNEKTVSKLDSAMHPKVTLVVPID